jgi:hypothetical protein
MIRTKGARPMKPKTPYATRAGVLRAQMADIEDPIARIMLKAFAEALDEAAAEQMQMSGGKPPAGAPRHSRQKPQ